MEISPEDFITGRRVCARVRACVCVCVHDFTGRNVYRILFKGRQIERNELFLPGRMAYVVDLEDEYADTDIPTTLIRSKADCPTMEVPTHRPSDTPLSSDITHCTEICGLICRQTDKQRDRQEFRWEADR